MNYIKNFLYKFLPIIISNNGVKIENIPKTSNDKAPNGESWIEYYENNSGKKAHDCSNLHCSNKATDGGHVRKISDTQAFIIPLCGECNNYNHSPFFVSESELLIEVPKD